MSTERYWKWEGSPWKSESAWLTWQRGAIRRVWNRHPLKIKKLHLERFRIPNTNPVSAKRFPEVWGAKCACCGGVFPLSGGRLESGDKITMQVDHIEAAGQFKAVKDFQKFYERMMCIGIEDLRIVCSDCNKTLALADRKKITYEEAKAERFAIALIKAKGEVKWLESRGLKPQSTSARRRLQVVERYKEEIGEAKK